MSAASSRATAARVLVLGGSSEIGLAIVRELQRRAPREVALVGRNAARLATAAQQLRERGCARVSTVGLDALQTESHEQVLDRAFAELGGADVVIVAVGILGQRDGKPADVGGAVEVLRVNLVGAGSLLLHAARRLREDGGGAIVVLSSVAAERPRAANFVYGASKAGLDALARGLAEALHGQGVHVLVVRPGFVRTRMTRGLQAAPLATEPDAVAAIVADGLERGARIVWAPRALRWLMLVLRMLPSPLLRRLGQ